ncbi:hypothetical protein TNCV_3867051 [Trichonephila clavipes]|nr:hypothetical protein TNCV_3867051 [Trichonephila clavipes]
MSFTCGRMYGSARASVLKRLDTIHHSALRICSLVPSELRLLPACVWYAINRKLWRKQLSANYFVRAMSVPSHPLKPFALAIGLNRLYEARSFNIKLFFRKSKVCSK